jgi:nucleoporin SEH1
LATCSADQHIKIFEKESTGWELSASFKAHDSAIIKVTWAGPEYGQVIASCSHDATVRIFEEDPKEPLHSPRRWKKRHVISDFRGPLYDVEFAPSHLGLKLASIGSDGTFRVHEALDPNTLSYWTLSAEVNMLTNPVARHLQSSFALSWCPSMFFKEYIVCCVLEDGFIYQRDHMGKFIKVAQLPEHKGLIRDVAWAPSMGRSYQLIATASKDGFVRIFKVFPVDKSEDATNGTNKYSDDLLQDTDINDDEEVVSSRAPGPLKVELLSQFDDHRGEVWRVSWNLTGTILASAGDDGKTRFWKSSYSGSFQSMAVVSAEQRDDET